MSKKEVPTPVPRYTVKTQSIDPKLPQDCVTCLRPPTKERPLVYRRSDGTVERICAVLWPYCTICLRSLAAMDMQQRMMTLAGAGQMLVILYAVGGAMGYYDFWFPSLGLLALGFVAFVHFAKKARSLWELEWARIDDVYKGGVGAAFSFRNKEYAERFAALNAARANDDGENVRKQAATTRAD